MMNKDSLRVSVVVKHTAAAATAAAAACADP